ncbi:MAG: protein kinase domain-containing protein [Cyanobacteriota bacterium]
MDSLLRPGAILHCDTVSGPIEVLRLLGRGGQGEVYEVAFAGEALAVKWYSPQFVRRDPELVARLRDSIGATPPSAAFLWPLTLLRLDASSAGKEGLAAESFGYLMPLRPPAYRAAVDHEAGRLSISLRNVVRACYFLAEAFDRLHNQGLCYKDISIGNLFLNPEDGRILICDNDNVAVTGAGRGATLGTAGYMAPEVLLGQARPSTTSDLFSLAVLIFRLLTRSDPFKGRLELQIRCLDAPAQRQRYGIDPVFVFDPHDERNRPDPEVHRAACLTWTIYPESLKRLFRQTFGAGLRHPDRRVLTGQWCETLAAVLDHGLLCPECGQEVFSQGKDPERCWACGASIPSVRRLQLPRGVVLAQPDNELHPHHFDPRCLESLETPLARVESHPRDGRLLGLHNLSEQDWHVELVEGGTVVVAPGRRCNLARVARIHTHLGSIEVAA